MSVLEVIKHYQRAFDKCNGNQERIMHCLNKLYHLPITVQHLQETGIGRTVNNLRGYPGEIAEASKALVAKWKAIVEEEEERAMREEAGNNESPSPGCPEDEDDEDDDDRNNLSLQKRPIKNEYSPPYISESKKSKYDTNNDTKTDRTSEDLSHSKYTYKSIKNENGTYEKNVYKPKSVKEERKRKGSEYSHDRTKRKYIQESSEDEKEDEEINERQKDSDDDDDDEDRVYNGGNEDSDYGKNRANDSDAEDSEDDNLQIDDVNVKTEQDSEADEPSEYSHQEEDNDSDNEYDPTRPAYDRNLQSHHSKSQNHYRPMSKHSTSNEKTKESHKDSHRDRSDKSKTSPEGGRSRHTKDSSHKSSLSKAKAEYKVSIANKGKSESDSGSKSKKHNEKHGSGKHSSENHSSKHSGEKQSSKKHSDNRNSEKHSIDSHSNEKQHSKKYDTNKGSSDKHHVEKHSDKHTNEKRDKQKSEKHSTSKSETKSSSQKPSSSSSNSKENTSIPIAKETGTDKKKVKKKDNRGNSEEGGIDNQSGATFADALGMFDPIVKKKSSAYSQSANKSSKSSSNSVKNSSNSTKKPSSSTKSSTHTDIKPSSSSSKNKSSERKSEESKSKRPKPPVASTEQLDLLSSSVKLQPLEEEVDVDATLPAINPNYRPLGYYPGLDDAPHKASRVLSEEEALSRVMSNKNQRTKVYSGVKSNKSWNKVPTLYELCVRILVENIDAIEYTGGIPFSIMEPILKHATPQQLFQLEHYNPYLVEDTDELWTFHVNKEFRNKQRQEMETSREMYIRCIEEREARLKALTSNIQASIAKSMPVRQTKLAYVDSVAKPPRNVARKQAKFGTARTVAPDPLQKTTKSTTAGSSASSSSGSSAASGPTRPIYVPPPKVSAAKVKPKMAPLMQKTMKFMKGFKR